MTNTTYYNLNIVEGTDIVNPLIVDNPNYEKIDEVMHGNAVSGVTLATEIANATVHAITRENSECAVIRFIATSEWKAGDTITVDGVPVTALLPSGETLPDGAYVINANVLCILTGTNITVYAERKKTDSANEIAYNGTTVSAELDKINSNLTSYCDVQIPVDTSIQKEETQAGFQVRATRKGNIVVIHGRFAVNTGTPLTAGATFNFAQLPIGYRPIATVGNFLFGVGKYDAVIEGIIQTNGLIQIRPTNKEVTDLVYIPTITYFTNDPIPT